MVAFFRDVHARWMPWNLPEKIAISGWALKGRPLLDYTIGLEGSLIMVGAGAIMGARAAWSMLLGAAVNFGVLAPWLYSDGVFDAPVSLPFDPEGQCADPWAWSEHTEPGLPGAQECLEAASYDWYCELAMLGTSTDTVLGYKNIVAWSVWFGSAMILTSGLLAFAFQWRTVLRAIQSVGSAFSTAATAGGTREVPMSWFFFGMALFAPLVVFLQWLFFGIHPLLGVVAVVLSFFIAIVASRATGETDTTPTGALGKITQITFGALDPGNTTTNLMTANVTGGVGLHCADLLTDLKSGYLLKADPRQQFWGQFFGVLAGSLFVVPAYRLLIPTAADIGTDKWPAPGAQTWKGVAEMLAKGFFTLHPTAQVALLVGAVLGIVLVLLEKFVPRVKPYLPSATAFGMAFTTPAYNTVSMCVGAAIAVYLEKRRPKLAEDAIVPVSSGLIAGESLMGVAVAALVVLGLLEG
jgi:OPT family oligopeptide transporter